ncbi:hypothetical protein [Mycoplasma bradburyae]|uniref:Lipoprotein n=1 Tax=Mycoplasma bradburyae TaxID=2963128 RepID=A0AAW6HS29_9MOLU|nr:hypothetical protein [Mycoplasma bradburyae]MDC4181997.1 hypothetical protein [Mycoplasma bradburyae]MDC4183373.1 hypothetical protein [Mycoplasma bradburyae]UTS70422.1 hypothetical protein NMG68_01645 [Mycoplasma bradburyae]
MKRKNFLKLVSLLSIASVAAISVASCKKPTTEQKMPQKSDDSNNKKTESDDNKTKEEKTTPPTESKPIDTDKKTDNQPSKESVDESNNKADSDNSGTDSSAMNHEGMPNRPNQDGNSSSTGTGNTSNAEGSTEAGRDAAVDHQSNEVKNPKSSDGSKSEDSEKTGLDKEEMPPVDPSFASGGLTTSWGDTGLPGIDNKESTDKLEDNPSETGTKDNDLMQPSVSDSGVGMTHSWADDGISQPIGGETSPTESEHFTTGWAENGAYNNTDPSQPDQAYPPATVGYPYGSDEATTRETSPEPIPSDNSGLYKTSSWGDTGLTETSPDLSK